MSQLFITATHKSSGKTTLSIGLCAAFRLRGRDVQPFKKGPDYIDPLWLSRAAGRDCHNLDFHTMSRAEILRTAQSHGGDADLCLIEGNKGLYDGLDLDGSNSNAALATLLRSPVILVIDAQGMTRGIAPLILGYQAFAPEVNIAGVILNQLGGHRHETKLRAVIEHYTDVPVIGAVHRNPALRIRERHLGLVPSNEAQAVKRQIDAMAQAIEAQVDLHRLLTIADTAPLPTAALLTKPRRPTTDLRIAIARDAAFGFYYPGDLDAFAQAGAELLPFNTLHDSKLPADIDGLFIGGGFPETQMPALEANTALRQEIRCAINAGLPTYAECGGLMYLTRSIKWKGHRCEMVGALPADSVMHERPQGRGYVQLQETGHMPWATPSTPRDIEAHEFHYSALENLSDKLQFAYAVKRGSGIDGHHDGLIHRNVLACYAHLRNMEGNRWVARFVDFVRQQKLCRVGTAHQNIGVR
ncbi:MAG TPA: cobyrinate a,c-diamide synthase [Gammaproteobacteria bacterium]|nr:cobyrinate a,c-diamide synthase [Gammaproteobacteria bacterium]